MFRIPCNQEVSGRKLQGDHEHVLRGGEGAGFRLYAAISESLGLEEGYIKKTLGEQEQHMTVNFYPQCPEPPGRPDLGGRLPIVFRRPRFGRSYSLDF
ncbi:hypothetical protein GUJ93_ZPchr0013g37962 [Zizania palustris]|uniref:Uncharacterized protein n=1 Tax=Zizania palustris TaxID=103762 RepID=A0A8J5WWH6_ZIZPA|nr:hypothetical protein GUJ93_ZPchr0013g37962 [Zizania palustris]